MAKIKYFNKETQKWEYADTGGGVSQEYVDNKIDSLSVPATEDMTQPIGKNAEGKLVTKAGGDNGTWELLDDFTVTAETEPMNAYGKYLGSIKKYKELYIIGEDVQSFFTEPREQIFEVSVNFPSPIFLGGNYFGTNKVYIRCHCYIDLNNKAVVDGSVSNSPNYNGGIGGSIYTTTGTDIGKDYFEKIYWRLQNKGFKAGTHFKLWGRE